MGRRAQAVRPIGWLPCPAALPLPRAVACAGPGEDGTGAGPSAASARFEARLNPLRTALLLLTILATACASAPRAPDLAHDGFDLVEPADAVWFLETTASPGLLSIEGDRASLSTLRGDEPVALRVLRKGPVWRLTGAVGGVPIDLRLTHASRDFAWLWAVGSPLSGFAYRLDASPEPLLGEWHVEPLGGSQPPRAIRLEPEAIELVEESSVRRLGARILVISEDERVVVASAGWEAVSERLHLFRCEGGGIFWREGAPAELGVLHRPGERPGWLARDEGAPAEPKRYALPTLGEARLELEPRQARLALTTQSGDEAMTLRVGGTRGPLVRFEDSQKSADAFLLQAGWRAWFWVEGEGAIVPAFALDEPAPSLLGEWTAAVAKPGAGGHQVAAVEIGRDRVAFLSREGERTEHRALHTGPPEAPVLLLTGAASGLTLSLAPRGETLFVKPSRPELTLTLLHRPGRMPAWLPAARASELLEAFCEEARRASRAEPPHQRIEGALASLEARGHDTDLLKHLLRPVVRMPGDRYELLLQGLETVGAPEWKCRAARALLAP